MNHHVQGQTLAPQASIHHLLLVQNLDQSFIKPLAPTSYVISLTREGCLDIAPHSVEPTPLDPPPALLLCLPLPSLKRHAFRLLTDSSQPEFPPLFVNGHPCSSHDLVHGDLLQLGQGLSLRYYIIPGSLDLTTLQDLLQLSNGEHWYETCLNIFNSFSTALPDLTPSIRETGLTHLALLTEFTPELIIELDLDGNILYLNATAWKQCPDLLEQGQAHPLFSGLQLHHPSECTTEIALGEQQFLRTSQFDPAHQIIRIFARPHSNSEAGETPQLPMAPPPSAASQPSTPQEPRADDYLTHLPERGAVETYLRARLVEKQEEILAVCLLNFDHFTQINEIYGYQQGDQILQALSQRLQAVLGENTFCGRWGGDEFLIILCERHLERIHQAAQTIIASFPSQLETAPHQTPVTASMGIALAPQHGEETLTLIEKAYTALRQAKHQGKQCYQLYHPERARVSSNHWQEDLKLALERDQLSVHYQPIVNPQTGSILSLEALLRWQHPQYGFIHPAQFIPVAEETGLILAMGQWLLRTVGLQHQRWQRMGLPKLPISINFSSRQLQQPGLRENLSQILEQTGWESRYLIIEVKEGTLVEDLTHAPRKFWELVELGLRFCVDNFGQGSSSFSRLQQLPIYNLKTDPSLVENLGQDNAEAAVKVLEAILKLSKSLKLQLVVKGVDNKEQLACLREIQVQAVQGDFIYAAMPSFQITQILQRHFQYAV